MSEEPTQPLPSERSFEERVFGQFDAMNKRFDSIDARLQKLETGAEQKAFDTKPIWERALAEILETRQDVGALRSEAIELRSQMTGLRAELTELRSEVTELHSEVTELHSEVTELHSEVSALRSEVSALRSEVTELRSEVSGLRSEVTELRSEVSALRSEVTELRSETKEGFRDISRKLVVIFDDIVQLRADQLYAGNRLDKLESKPM